MADEPTTETVETPPGVEITPSGGITTRTDGTPTPVVTDWRASLPLELQAEPTLARYKSLDEALKGAVHAQKLIGRGIEYPGADAKPEVVAEFRKRAGVPESPEKYGVTLPQAPEGVAWDQGLVGAFLTRMHAVHARPEVVQAGLEMFVEAMAKQSDRERSALAQESQADRAAAVKALEALWGPQGGALWKHHNSRAITAIETLMGDAPPEAIQRVKESANDPEVAHAFSLMADALIERGFVGEAEQASSVGIGDVLAKADAIRDAAAKNPAHPFNDPTHPEHEKIVAEFLAYHARAAGPRGREVVAEVRR
jgi:hypothetical protein